jgi:hypothetical protein
VERPLSGRSSLKASAGLWSRGGAQKPLFLSISLPRALTGAVQ